MSKTKRRILAVSLQLFNDEAETEHTAVDIANELDISPGNLYYHFKGKDAIIAALFDDFEEEINIVLEGGRENIRTIEDLWVYCYILLAEIYDFRFFYRRLDLMLARYPALARRFREVLKRKRRAISDFLQELESEEIIFVDPRLRPVLIEQIMSTLTFWLNIDAIHSPEKRAADNVALIHKTVFQMIAVTIPFMGEEGQHVLDALVQYYDKVEHTHTPL